MKESITNIAVITFTLLVSQGVLITLFYLIGSISLGYESFGLAFFSWILSIISLSVIAERFGDKKISLSIENEIQ